MHVMVFVVGCVREVCHLMIVLVTHHTMKRARIYIYIYGMYARVLLHVYECSIER